MIHRRSLSPRATFLGWLVLLGITLAVAVLGSGCSKQIPNCPTPTAAYTSAWCTAGVRDGKDFLFCTPSRSLCQYAVDRANAFNEVAHLGIERLSGCGLADATMTVKKPEK